MSARDDAVTSLTNAGYSAQIAREILAGVVAEEGAQRDRHWAQRIRWAQCIREVGAAKGWSVWTAALIDPDVSFVDTGMPATETIVAELRRLDRLAVLKEIDEDLATMTLPEYLQGTLYAGSYAQAWQDCRARVQAHASAGGPEKDTSDGDQPPAGESTPAPPHFFQPGHTYTDGSWIYRCDAVSTHPDTGDRTAIGWLRLASSRTRDRARSHVVSLTAEDWADGWTDSATGGS